jgi:hypothetical protein
MKEYSLDQRAPPIPQNNTCNTHQKLREGPSYIHNPQLPEDAFIDGLRRLTRISEGAHTMQMAEIHHYGPQVAGREETPTDSSPSLPSPQAEIPSDHRLHPFNS